MKIAFIGTSPEKTKDAFNAFISANFDDINLISTDRVVFKDGTIVFTCSLSNVEHLSSERMEEIIWVPPICDEKYTDLVQYIRGRIIKTNIPEEFREWVFC